MKRITTIVLALALTLSLGVCTFATDNVQATVMKTDIPAQYVYNFEGYGSIAASADDVEPGAEKFALINSKGEYLFPYENSMYSDLYWKNAPAAPIMTSRFSVSEGIVSLSPNQQDKYLCDTFSAVPALFKLDGSPAFKMPDHRSEYLAELEERYPPEKYSIELGEPHFVIHDLTNGVLFVREWYVSEDKKITRIAPWDSWGGVDGEGFNGPNDYRYAFLMDTQGNILCELGWEYLLTDITFDAEYFRTWLGDAGDGLIPVVDGYINFDGYYTEYYKYGYINYAGELVLDLMNSKYSSFGSFCDGLAPVKDAFSGKWGYINTSGEEVIPCRYDFAHYFTDGYAGVEKDDKFGLIDKAGNLVIPFQYEDGFGTSEGYMIVSRGEKYGIVDLNNRLIVPMEYDDLSDVVDGVAYAVRDGLIEILSFHAAEGAGQTDTLAHAGNQTITVDGKPCSLQTYALLDENGYQTNYVRLRDIAELLNGTAAQFEVKWDGNVNLIPGQSYTRDGSEMKTPFSGDRAYRLPGTTTNINGKPVFLAAILLNDDIGGGYTYYQLRDLGKTLGFNVGWSAERGIFLESDRAYTDAD